MNRRNLDKKNTQEVIELLHLLTKEYKTSIVMVTHDLDSTQYCHKVYELKDGKAIIKGRNLMIQGIPNDYDLLPSYQSRIE